MAAGPDVGLVMKRGSVEMSEELAEDKNIAEDQYWICDRYTINAAYGEEQIELYAYLPKNFQPPYQTIVYWITCN